MIGARQMGATTAETLDNTLIAEMSSVLRAKRVDVDDERAVLVTLQAARFRPGDIVALAERAVEEARRADNADADPQWAKDQSWGGR